VYVPVYKTKGHICPARQQFIWIARVREGWATKKEIYILTPDGTKLDVEKRRCDPFVYEMKGRGHTHSIKAKQAMATKCPLSDKSGYAYTHV
jgi:hypothetical protein